MAKPSSVLLAGGTLLVHSDDDRVRMLRDTDLLIENNKIAKIEQNIQPPSGAQFIDCKDKIISPGFVGTHHHVWQTQLKGRHSDDTLLDYHPKGNLQYYNYTPEDVFWGELCGLLEAIDSGTTTIVDHAHMSGQPHNIGAGLSATMSSGIRSVFCYSLVMNIEKWDQNELTNAKTAVPEWWLPLLDHVAKHDEIAQSDRVDVGLGFDSYHLPEEQVKEIFEKARGAGMKLITSHWRRNNIAGMSCSSNGSVAADAFQEWASPSQTCSETTASSHPTSSSLTALALQTPNSHSSKKQASTSPAHPARSRKWHTATSSAFGQTS